MRHGGPRRRRVEASTPTTASHLSSFISYVSIECGRSLLGVPTVRSKMRETIFRSIVDREPEDGKVELAKLMRSVEHEPHLKALVQGELRFWSQPVEPPEMGKWLSAERQFGALVAKADDPFRLVCQMLLDVCSIAASGRTKGSHRLGI